MIELWMFIVASPEAEEFAADRSRAGEVVSPMLAIVDELTVITASPGTPIDVPEVATGLVSASDGPAATGTSTTRRTSGPATRRRSLRPWPRRC